MVQNRFRRLRWESVEEITRSNAATAAAQPEIEALGPPDGEAAESPLTELLRRTGVPRHPDPNASALDEAEFLLQAAAEVEHQFIVQYLYALFGLDLAAGGAVAAQCRTHLEAIAEEEMGHLLTVQNVLLLIDAPPYLEREGTSPADPLPFPLKLEPPSLSFVSRFLVAESPVGVELPDNLGDLKGEIEHIGALYAMLYWLFQDGDAPQGPWQLPPLTFPSGRHLKPEHYNADATKVRNLLNRAADWGAALGGVHVLPPQTAALNTPAQMADAGRRALYDVALQGEGPAGAGPAQPKDTSHYHRLLGLYESIKGAGESLKLALDVPVNPHTVPAGAGDPEAEPGLITDGKALLNARLFDLRYSMLLLEIFLSVMIPRTRLAGGAPVRRTLARRALRVEMVTGIGALSRRLVKLARKASQGGVAPPYAGAPYGLTAGLFPQDERAGWQSLLRLIDESAAVIEEAGDAAGPEMETLREEDETFRPFVQARIDEFN
jgi:hypothetical protein